MFYYLMCSTPCAVKLNGEFIGKASCNYSVIDADEGLIELLPEDETYGETAFYLGKDNDFKNGRVLSLGKEGKLVIPKFKRRLFSDFKLLGRREINFSKSKLFLTCYAENGVRLVLETYGDMNAECLPFYPGEIKIEKIESRFGEYLLVFLIGKRTMIVGYRISDKIELVFKTACDLYKLERDKLTVTEIKADILKHIVSTVWSFSSSVKAINSDAIKKREVFSLNETLFKYAFFEELLIGGNAEEFLTARLRPRADELKGFFGDFTAVLPPPHFKGQDLVALLYADKIKYARVFQASGLIDNVSVFESEEV